MQWGTPVPWGPTCLRLSAGLLLRLIVLAQVSSGSLWGMELTIIDGKSVMELSPVLKIEVKYGVSALVPLAIKSYNSFH